MRGCEGRLQENTPKEHIQAARVHSSCTSSQRSCNGRCLARGAQEEYDTPRIHHARVRAIICGLWHSQKKRSPWHLCADGTCAPMSPVRHWHLGAYVTCAQMAPGPGRHLGYLRTVGRLGTEGTWVPMQTAEQTFEHK